MMYTHDALEMGLEGNGYYQMVEEYSAQQSRKFEKGALFDQLKNNNIYPCWYCAESEYIDFENFYVPFYNLDNGELKGLLILQKNDGITSTYYLTEYFVSEQLKLTADKYAVYWAGIMTYFRGKQKGKDKKDYFNYRSEYCLKGIASGCKCSVSFIDCGSIEVEAGGLVIFNCDEPCGSDGNGNAVGDITITIHGRPLTIANISTWLFGSQNTSGSGGGGGGNNSLSPDSDVPWDEECGEFNGSLGTANNTTLNEDGSTDIPLFDNPADLYLIQLNSIINQYGMQSQFTPQELMDYIGEECAVSNVAEVSKCIKCHLINDLGLSDDQNHILMDNFGVVADCNGDMDCILAGLIESSDCKDDLDYFISSNNLELSLEAQWAILDVTQNDLGQSYCSNFTNKAWAATVNHVTGSTQSPSDILLLVNHIKTVDDKMGLLDYYATYTELRIAEPDVRWDRSIELYDIISAGDDNVLISDCGDVSDWSDLASFVPPQKVLDKLDDLGEGWRIQALETPTASPSLNLDYFSTTITQMPIKPETGEEWLPEELFKHIRKNINDFVDTGISEFYPIEGDLDLWLSDNPVPAVVSIDIDLVVNNVPGDDGTVIASQNESCCWIFTTVTAPGFTFSGDGNDGFHPVSGNRQFGYTLHPDGSMEIYTRGVDRFLFPTSGSPFASPEKILAYIMEKVAFSGADGLWESFQQGISNFVNNSENPENAGESVVNNPITKRPSVTNEMIDALKQTTKLNHVPCGN